VIHEERVSRWLEDNIAGLSGPFRFEMIAGGRSNITYRVGDSAGNTVVLRRPPIGHVLATAHDMAREHRIISAVGTTDVPVPRTLGVCNDVEVNDAPFYVMDFVVGHVVRDNATALEVLTPATRRRASLSLVETMAAIHAVDLDAVGLADLGRHEGYIERQLKRWYGQWNASKTRELGAIDRVHDALSTRIPTQGPATIVHGDYRLDNCMVNDEGNVIAVLDWELCTLGDPMADLGLLMVYWTGPHDEPSTSSFAPTTTEGFLDRAELAAHYAKVSGRDVSQLDYYVSFAYWKLACIIEGVYARYVAGAMGTHDPSSFAAFATQVEAAAQRAEEVLARLH